MATAEALPPTALPNATGDPEKTMSELNNAMTETKLEDATVVPNAQEKAEDNADPPISSEDTKLPHSSADGLIKTPLDAPLGSSKPVVRPALSIDQDAKYKSLLQKIGEWTAIPEKSARGSQSAPLTDSERMWLTRECLLRYLRATSWNVAQAETRLQNTLVWRREYGVEKLTADYISIENATGKQLILGWDNEGRPCQYMRPSKQNTERGDRQIEHLVFMLERSIDVMPPGQETLALVINFAETKSGQGASIGQGKQTLNILQNHYPERLGRALVTNVPFYIWGFFKLITPFIDPLTREKIKFNEDTGLHVPREQLLKESGGHVEFEYDHATYWPALNKLCETKRAQYQKRWEDAGKRIGELEGYLKGGSEKSLADEAKTQAVEDESVEEHTA